MRKKAIRKKVDTSLPLVPAAVQEVGGKPSIPNNVRNSDGTFKPGFNARAFGVNPNPPKQSGRRRILSLFDRIVGEEAHLDLLELEIRKYIESQGMLAFYQHYVFPLIPKEMVLTTVGIDSTVPTEINFNFTPRKKAVDIVEEN